ncbi:hypothetical protein GC093_24655 [Paenibacillus sp. LMG 31456]|uniref:Uncharacterized protein n=1 Tax=Paenibacillus foliorum TaxID=2654974 RepID=A0A972K246_9BACL|nr:hypothetical protein [Paenibacillus foliorum]NOU96381.1 hypothetical protein [Paenibacillus foliorum]
MSKVRLLVKHAVTGKMLLDSDQQPVTHTLVALPDGGWKLSILEADPDKVERILQFKHELNVFIFEASEGQPIVKNWYYVKDGHVEYEEANSLLTIVAASHITYLPSDYLE